MMFASTLAVLTLAFPQEPSNPPTVESLLARSDRHFVDFSAELMQPRTGAWWGRLGRMKEGRRERIREGGRLGGENSVRQISGTQYFRVPVRTLLQEAEQLAGSPLSGRIELRFDVQFARLPDGSESRQALTPDRTPLREDLLGLWIVTKPEKGRGWSLQRVLAFDPAVDTGEQPEQAFMIRMRDYCQINQAIADLRAALAVTEEVAQVERPMAAQREAALKPLRAARDAEISLEDPRREGLVGQHVEPWRRRVSERIAKLEDDGLGGESDGTGKPPGARK